MVIGDASAAGRPVIFVGCQELLQDKTRHILTEIKSRELSKVTFECLYLVNLYYIPSFEFC